MRDDGSGELLEDEGGEAGSGEGRSEGSAVSYDSMELETVCRCFEGWGRRRNREGSSKR